MSRRKPPQLAFAPRGEDWSRFRWKPLDRTIAKFESQSLLNLVAAAIDSPECGHRLPSLTLIWSRVASRAPQGALLADPSHLHPLVQAARIAAPQLEHL